MIGEDLRTIVVKFLAFFQSNSLCISTTLCTSDDTL